ncbi:MAG: alanine dehydrogenase [Gammaproteobacteria bacterium]|jgi:alanine dehydrogenase
MKIGVVKEVKDKENRVAITPMGTKQLIAEGHQVSIEENAGIGSGFSNEAYQLVGAEIVLTETAWDKELVVKIKEPLKQEYQYLKENILFTYLHLAGVTPTLTDALIKAKTSAIAYETVENDQGHLPLLAPMSAVAGNIAANVGTYYLADFNGGNGVQLGRVMGERHGKVMIIGSGIVGQHAAHTLDSMGAEVYVFDRVRASFDNMQFADPTNMQFIESTPENIATHIVDTDLVVGAVLYVGARAPHVVTEAMVKSMQAGSVIVDVSIDQGGCIETSRPTSHSDPVYVTHGVIHYCVTNMPGAYPRTSTLSLTNLTLSYISNLAAEGLLSLKTDTGFGKGLNTHQGAITNHTIATSLGHNDLYKPIDDIL